MKTRFIPTHSLSLLLSALWLALASLGLSSSANAQTASWINASGGDWNTAVNWDVGVVPGAGTNAIITNGAAYTVTYTSPMAAPNIAALTVAHGASAHTLTISAGGFNVAGTTAISSNAVLNVLPGGVMTNNTLNMAIRTSAANIGGIITNATTQVSNDGNNDGGAIKITNGMASLGNVTIRRSGSTAFSSGLTVQGGSVTANNVTIGTGNSFCYMSVGGGTVNIAGDLRVGYGNASSRQCLYVQTNGTVNCAGTVSLGGNTNQIVWFNLGNPAAVFNASAVVVFTNPQPVTAVTVNFTNGGTMYIGAGGILVTNTSGNSYNFSLNDQGLFGASADWSGNMDAGLRSGTFTLQAADAGGTPHNITLNGVLRGIGALSKTGGGVLTLNANHTNSGSTLINGGSLVLGPSGSLSNSVQIIVGSAATFDVSGVTGGFVLNAGQTLAGSGVVTGAVAGASNSIINPGSNVLTGTLSFSNGIAEAGGVVNHFDLSSAPLDPNNDFITIASDLTLSGSNTVEVSGSLLAGSAYKLFHYGGSLILTDLLTNNLGVTGGAGLSLSNSVPDKTIYLLVQASTRGPTNVVWLGNPLNTNWDTQLSTNWLDNGSPPPDFFVSGDSARFDGTGASNSPVNIVATVMPAAVIVDASSNYTFAGSGSIGGTASLTKTNSGTLTILSTNGYTGPTLILGGVLEAATVANGGSASAIGAATSDPSTLALTNATFRYLGPTASSDRGATLGGAGATMDVPESTTLTLNGALTGNGPLTKVGTGTLALGGANNYSGMTIISNGTLTLNNASGAGSGAIVFDGGTLNLNVGSQPTYANALNIPVTSTLISAGGNNNIVGGSWTGDAAAVLNVSIASGTFTVNGSMTNFPGTIELGNSAGTFRFNSGGGNTSFGGPNTTFDLGTGTATLQARNPGTMTVGALQGGSGTFVKGPGSTAGTLIWAIGNNNVSTTYPGTIQNNAANEICALTKIGSGTLTLSGQNSYTGTTTITNGVLALSAGPNGDGSISASATINVMTGTVLDVSGRSDGTLPLGSAQTLEGRGTILGTLDASSGGTVAPGGGFGGNTGTLTVTNSATLGGTAWMKLNRANGPNSDRLAATNITLGGTLVVTNIGARLQVGDTFMLFSASGVLAGSFTTVVLPNYYSWNTNDLTVNGQVSVSALLPPPTVTDLMFSGGNVTLNATNGAPNGPLIVLSSTNVTLSLSSWTPVATNAFDANGVLTGLAIPVDPTVDEQYYVLQVR